MSAPAAAPDWADRSNTASSLPSEPMSYDAPESTISSKELAAGMKAVRERADTPSPISSSTEESPSRVR